MKLSALVTSFSVVAFMSGCGSKDAAQTIQDAITDVTGELTSDATAFAENQSDTLDEVASAINENGSGGSASALSLASPNANANAGTPKTGTHALGTRTCTADTTTGKVTVEISYDNTKKDTAEGKKGRIARVAPVNASMSGSGKLTRVWTVPTPADAACTKSGHFKFKDAGKTGASMVGLSLAETEARERTMNVSKAGKTLTGRTMSTAGTRSVTFAAVSDGSADYQKTITTDMTRTIKMTKPNGENLTRVKKVTTSASNPMVVKISRDDNGELESKVISSGEVKAEVTAEKTVITTTFSNVKYDFASTNGNKCTPVSGTITSATTKDGAAQKTFVIDFGADTTAFESGISIKVGDAAAVDCPNCVVAKCDLDETN